VTVVPAHRRNGGSPTLQVSTIAAVVKEYGITHILLGRTQRPWYQRWFGQSVLDQLLREVPGIDVTVVATRG
jgi:two-component system sensor histidine kinase KdpD